MPAQRGSTAVDSQQANLTIKAHREGLQAHDQTVPVRPNAIKKLSSPAAASAGTATRKTQSPAKQARESPSAAKPSKLIASKHDREAALQQLRLQEKAQLERLKQLTQQRRSQRLLEEQLQAEALYQSYNAEPAIAAVSASPTNAPAVTPSSSKKMSPKKRQRSPSPAVRAPLAALSSPAAAADKAASCKPLGRSSVKLQQLLNPVQTLPSFSSVKHGHSASKGANNTLSASKNVTAASARSKAGDARRNGAKDFVEAVNQHSKPAETDPPGHEHLQSQPAPGVGDPNSALHSAAVKKAVAYDKPWRQNMSKKPKTAAGQQQQPAATSAADVAGAPSAVAQLLATAADVSKPVVLRSKKRTPEQQAKLQAFMAAKYQEHLQQESEEKKEFKAAAARRQVIKQLAAQQREAARQRQLQHPSRHADTFHPENSWRGVLTPSSEGSQESVLDAARQGHQQQQNQAPQQEQKQQQEQPPAWQQKLQLLKSQRQEQLQQQSHWQQELHELQFQWQQQQQAQWQQQQDCVASSPPAASHATQHNGAAAALQPINQQQVLQQAGNAAWQQHQQQQKLNGVDEKHLQPGIDPAGSYRQQRHSSRSPEGVEMKLEPCQTNRDVSPGTAFLRDRQALLAANSMAKRQFDQRLRANHSAAAAVAIVGTSYFSAARPGSNVVAAHPAAAIAATDSSVLCMPEKATRQLTTALPAGNGSRGSASSRKASRTAGCAKKARSRTQHAASAAACGEHVKQQRRRLLLQQQLALDGACGRAFQPESSDEYEVLSESSCEASADQSPSPVRDQQPSGAVAAMAAADAAQQDAPVTALAQFWVQQHAADRKHASNGAMIQQLLLQSTMLKQRIEHICNQALKQRQQKQQQQWEQEQVRQQQQRQGMRAARVSLVIAPPAIEPPASGLLYHQQLADKLTELLRQQHNDDAPAAATTSASRKQLRHQQLHPQAAAKLPNDADSITSSSNGDAGEDCFTAVAAAIPQTGQLSAEGSKAWQQQLRAQLLEEKEVKADAPASADAIDGCSMQQHQGTAPAAHSNAATAEQPLLQPITREYPAADTAEQVSEAEQQLQLPGYGAGYAPNWGYDEHSSSLIDAQEATPGFKSQAEYDAAAYSSGSSSASSGFADCAAIGRGVRKSRQRLSFAGAFSHLETAEEAAAAASDRPNMQYNGALDCNMPGPSNAAGTAGDHVVTWYSAVGGSLDFGSPEPPSPKQEDSFSAHQVMHAASQATAASVAAAEADRPFMALSHVWDEHISLTTDNTGAVCEATMQTKQDTAYEAVQIAASQAMPDECSTSSSSSTSPVHNGRNNWDRCIVQEQPRQLHLPAATATAGLRERSDGVPEEVLPRWFGRPSWAAAGLGGYRWDSVSISSSSDSAASSPSAGVPCERIVQQHEALQQQQQLACIPRHDKAVVLDPKHQAEQTVLVLRNLDVGSEDENQQQLPFDKPTTGDPYSVINIFMRQHQERIERQKDQQQLQEQLLREKQQQEKLQHEHQRHQELLQLQLESTEQPQQQSAAEGELADEQQLTRQLLGLVNQQQAAQQLAASGQQPKAEQASQQHQAQHAVADSEARAISPFDVHASFSTGMKQQQSPPLHLESQEPDALQQHDWLEEYRSRSAAQQWLVNMDTAGVPGPEQQHQQQQERRRLSPDTLHRMHEEGLAKLETAQEAELDLLLLQQAHERTTLQQEAARVARDLDQQQLFALLQQQQHMTAREQVENSAGLFQRVTKDLLAETVSQLKDVSAVFAQQICDASRRSCGVQATEARTEPQDAAVMAVQLLSAQQEQQQLQDQQPRKSLSHAGLAEVGWVSEEVPSHYNSDRFESVQEQTTASSPGAAEWSAALPADQAHPAHPALHFQALLMAEQIEAGQATLAATEPDSSSMLEVSDAVGAAAEDQPASDHLDSHALEVSDSETRGQQLSASAIPSSNSISSGVVPEESITPVAGASAGSILYETSENGGAAYTFSQIAPSANAVDAAAKVSSASQQYGSSSFESCVDGSSMQQQPPRAVLEQQLAEAKQQLDVLSRHIDAIMIGYAVQAMQASRNKSKQAAIHQQALKEQQESAIQKQQLMQQVLSLQQQLGLRSSISDSVVTSADSEQATQAAAVAFLAQTAVSTAVAASAEQPASKTHRKQWQKPTSPAAAEMLQEVQQHAEEKPFAASLRASSTSPMSSLTEGSNPAAAADRDSVSTSSASEVASLGGAYSEDFEATEAPVVHSTGLAAAQTETTEQELNTQGSALPTGVHEPVPAPAASSDSLEIKQKQVILLQQKVAREFEKQMLDQQQAALHQLLQQLAGQRIAGGADVDRLLAAAGIQATAISPTATVCRDAVDPPVEQQQIMSVSAAEHSAAAVVTSYSDDFVSVAAQEQLGISHNARPTQHMLQSLAAHVLDTASSLASSISSPADEESKHWSLTASQLSPQLQSASKVQVYAAQTVAETWQAAPAVAGFVEARPADPESAAHPAAAAASNATGSQGYTDDGFCSVLSAASPPFTAAPTACVSAAALLDNSGPATTAFAEGTPVASVLDTVAESVDAVHERQVEAPGAFAAGAAPAAHGPVEVNSYELSASEVGTELLDDQLVEFELCASQQEYNAAACDEQHIAAAGEVALVDLQQKQQLQAQGEDRQQQYTMEFASSVNAEGAGCFNSIIWAAGAPHSSGTAPDSTPNAKLADQAAQAHADVNMDNDSSATPYKSWMVETAASSSISSTPVPSDLPPVELQFRQQFRNEPEATAEAPLQQSQTQQHLTAMALALDGQGAHQQQQAAVQATQHGKETAAEAAPVGDQLLQQQRPQEALMLQQPVGSSAVESLADSIAEELGLLEAEGIPDTGSELFVSGVIYELEACLEQQQAEQQTDAVAVSGRGPTSEAAIAEQPVLPAAHAEEPLCLKSIAGTAAAEAVEEALAAEAAPAILAVTDAQNSNTVSRNIMCSSTINSQGEGSYITIGRGGSGRVTADSIDLEYSDWTVDQQHFRRFSFDLAADAVPAELSAQQQAAEEVHVSLAAQKAATSAAAFALSTTTGAKQMVNETLCKGKSDADCSGSLDSACDVASAAEVLAPEAAGLARACPVVHVPRVAGAQAVDSNVQVQDELCVYSMDFSSMSLQQSLLTSVAEDTAAGAVPAAASLAECTAVLSQHVTLAQETEVLSAADEGAAACSASSTAAEGHKFEPLAEELQCKQHSREHTHAAVQLSQQQEQQSRSSDLADAICVATLDKMLDDVLSEAVHMWGSNNVPHQQQTGRGAPRHKQLQGHDQHHQRQKHAEDMGGSSTSVNSTESADTCDTADSSAGSKSIQPDWQSSPGSPPAHFSPLSMRAAAVASTVPIGGSIVNAAPSVSSPAGVAPCSSGLVSHPPTDWTPMSDDVTTPWSVEATASSRCDEATAGAAPSEEEAMGFTSTVRQLDSLLMQAGAGSDVVGERPAEAQQLQSSDEEQGPSGSSVELTASSADALRATATHVAATSTAADIEGAAVLPSARHASEDDEEFDWPDTEQARAASSSNSATAVPAAAPIQRRTPSPPPPVVDDSPAHTVEYVLSVLDTRAGPPINLPAVLALGEEPLGLDRYLWLEKDGRPDMSKLADGSDSDDRHIHHKALYDATNQAIMQLYAAVNRVQLHPVCEAAGLARLMRPLPSQQQLATEISAKVAGWAKIRVRDDVSLDKLLAEDALEDEKMWGNSQTEIAEIALEVESGIWADLVADTAAVLAGL